MSFPAEAPGSTPSAKVVELNTQGKDYLQLLGGPPESVTMRSGLVVLAPQHSVGKHSTHQNEEILVVLEGKGEMIFKDNSSLPVEANHAVYCPPQTEHDVKNTGNSVLRYVYVVASAR
jgi:mannose-6-phosphate isomerase-like protein (cupin superfamily)